MGNRPGTWALLAVLAAFALGIAGLLGDRLEEGDIYPAYSTLRSDPMGCRALFEALGKLRGGDADRALSPDDFTEARDRTAYFFLGTQGLHLEPDFGKDLDSLARDGGRVIFAWAPVSGQEDRKKRRRSGSDSAAAQGIAGTRDSAAFDTVSTQSNATGDTTATAAAKHAHRKTPKPKKPARWRPDAWGFRLALDKAGDSASLEARGIGGDSVAWIGDLWFDTLSADWTVLYRRDSLPVVAERRLGRGSVVLVADTYWASNESMFQSRPGLLLAQLLNGRTRLRFDERHLGVQENRSLAGLLAKYRLHYLLPSLLLLFLLYLWKVRAEPMPDDQGAPSGATPIATASGAPTGERGVRGLLRRYIPAGDLLPACWAQWKDTEGKHSPAVRRVEAEASAIAAASPGRSRNIVEDYRRIQALINRRKPQ